MTSSVAGQGVAPPYFVLLCLFLVCLVEFPSDDRLSPMKLILTGCPSTVLSVVLRSGYERMPRWKSPWPGVKLVFR